MRGSKGGHRAAMVDRNSATDESAYSTRWRGLRREFVSARNGEQENGMSPESWKNTQLQFLAFPGLWQGMQFEHRGDR